ncbi:hypothetical protein BJ508DRAFT_413060 [Ascobolus immersus RN42]|uniref:ABC transporter domain-containing protein n=1 Tax=Ascobolus immersus RN42 TaxID=1160509 RepID=A0A3N4IEM5_ASCIM|nr:hypothetical protein BJ508DRAFT_413060 [Ascobolus immersus RN42]
MSSQQNTNDLEKQPLPTHDGGVDVLSAELEYAELARELTRQSQRTHRSQRNKEDGLVDVASGKGSDATSSEDGDFDLEEYLRGQQDDGVGWRKKKRIGVLFQDLTVRGMGGVKTYIKTFPHAFIEFAQPLLNLLPSRRGGEEVEILRDFRGVLKPGEMCLVLGRPGSGCTTFLKVMANQRHGYTGVDGEVMYGRFGAETFGKKYRGEAVYNQEDDVHHPTLTVGQTLGFALDTKTPAKGINGMSKAEVKEMIIKLLLKMFNIEHTRNTIVGNAFIRGVSGGERKRVSIAEMMITKATVCCWDNATRGLDASTALDYAKSMRIMTNIYQTTTFVSLYQASESIYKLFDKVLVIDEGRQVYFGPTSEARAYFEGLGYAKKPRQTTPDYLTGCTDEFEREFADGMDQSTVPCGPDRLQEAFRKSEAWKTINQEMEAYREEVRKDKDAEDEFIAAVKEGTKKAKKRSVYTIPYSQQVWALCKRQFALKWQDKLVFAVGWLTSLVIAFLVGSLYLNVPATSKGAFDRGGILFISILFNAFQAFSELPGTMMGRPILNRHKQYAFHRPSTLYVAQILVDLAFMSVQVFMYCLIVYFMTGLVRTAGAFFTFYLFIMCGYLAMALFFRVSGCLAPDFDSAIKPVGILITFMVVTCGYLIAPQYQQKWMSWIFYISGLGLSFSSLMANEFGRLDLKCGPESLVPYGPGYNDLRYQTCALAGSKPGSDIIDGSAYIEQTYEYRVSHIWRNFGIVLAVIIGSLLANMAASEYIQFNQGGKTVTFYAKENDERKKLNEKLKEKRNDLRLKRTMTNNRDTDSDTAGQMLKIESTAVLTWENLCYTVPVPGGQKQLLDNIFGYVKPGELTALMGASGAGKTTLLDVLASRKSIGVITGDVLIDGAKIGTAFQRGTAYAEQLDTHEPTQTVREALRFSAYLRQPATVSKQEKDDYVEQVITLLEMDNIADAIIGSPESGLAVEERKRVTIGVELAAKPELLLFLDEPTSGLDSQSAFNIVRFLRKLAHAGQAILCTIHQPNASLFENFDRLLLLQRGGQTVYFGDIGHDAKTLLGYFEKNGAVCPPDANPAEFILDAVGAGSAPRIGNRDWHDIWKTSPEFQATKDHIVQLKRERMEANKVTGSNDHLNDASKTEYATSHMTQLRLVTARTFLSFWRTPNYGYTRLFNHVALGLVSGLAFLKLDNSLTSMQQRIFVIFQTVVLPALILAQIEPKYQHARSIFMRENSSKMYGRSAFVISLVTAEMPYSVLCAVGFWITLYLPPGLRLEPSRAGYQFAMMLVCEIFSVTFGQAIAAWTPSPLIASLMNPPFLIIMSVFAGVNIPKANIPSWWRWLYEVNPFTRLLSGMISTELHGLAVKCTNSELNRFLIPDNASGCQEYAGEFARKAGGYLVPLGDKVCGYCKAKTGDAMLVGMGMADAWENRGRDIGILCAFAIANLVILGLGARFGKFGGR